MAGLTQIAVTGKYYYGNKTILYPNRWYAYHVKLPTAKLYYVINGELALSHSGQEMRVKAGEIALIPPNVCHSYYLPEQQTAVKYWMHFDLFANGSNLLTGLRELFKITVDTPMFLKEQFETILSSNRADRFAPEVSVIHAVISIATYFLERANPSPTVCEKDPIYFAIEAAEHPDNTQTLAEMAAAAHLSVNQFLRQFKNRTGFSPMHYKTVIRIENAKSLLENTNLSIADIMEKVGYSAPAYFARVFRTYTGYSPKDFRRLFGRQ